MTFSAVRMSFSLFQFQIGMLRLPRVGVEVLPSENTIASLFRTPRLITGMDHICFQVDFKIKFQLVSDSISDWAQNQI